MQKLVNANQESLAWRGISKGEPWLRYGVRKDLCGIADQLASAQLPTSYARRSGRNSKYRFPVYGAEGRLRTVAEKLRSHPSEQDNRISICFACKFNRSRSRPILLSGQAPTSCLKRHIISLLERCWDEKSSSSNPNSMNTLRNIFSLNPYFMSSRCREGDGCSMSHLSESIAPISDLDLE